ncbi:MAG: aspartate--tRNA(Asn) ligase [Candidatus Parcubacteria bacterium]|nr:aspartate--tRNA(Asn) ligase [Candidatus Parcubacteria bacterium]
MKKNEEKKEVVQFDLSKLNEKRTLIKDIKSGKVELAGWVQGKRDIGKIKFLLLRDITGIIQITSIKGKTDDKVHEILDKISDESVIYVKGEVKESKQAPGGKEIIPEKVEVLARAGELPIDVSDFSKTELPKRLDYRFLDLHRRRTQAIFKIQNEIAHAFREYFYEKGFFEMQSPGIISNSSEGGTELFEVKYFEKKAYLAQSPQLYKQMIACSMEKAFYLGPSWRAEKHNTTRHINEIRMVDIEAAFYNQESIMKELEESVKYVVKKILENCKIELEILDVKLKIPKGIYLSYEEAIKKAGGKMGEDFTPEQEKKLCDLYPGDIVFTHSWPTSIKPFYIMPKDEKKDAKLSEGFDALYGGVEISSGGQRIHIPELLEERIKAKGLNSKNFKDYIDSFRYGAPPHSGWAIGLERITQIICGLDNIKEATMFPRDRDRLTP